MTPIFSTERLIVRHLGDGDLDDMAAICGDPVAMRYMGDGTILSRETVAKWIQISQRNYDTRGFGVSAIIHKADHAFAGFCGIIRAPGNDFDEMIYALRQTYWGQGLATEVARGMLDYGFAHCALMRIYATIDRVNIASVNVVEKADMTFEKQVNHDGVDVLYYVIERPMSTA